MDGSPPVPPDPDDTVPKKRTREFTTTVGFAQSSVGRHTNPCHSSQSFNNGWSFEVQSSTK